jgi:hypothetical protein
MNPCQNWEEKIALTAGGDLCDNDLEQHLAECQHCAATLAALRESLALLQEAHADPIAEAHYAAVRARVLSRIDSRRNRRWLWAPALVGAAVAAIALITLPSVPPPPPVVIVAPPAPAAALHAPAPARAANVSERRASARRRPAAKPPLPSPPVLVKFVTDDPNVVIYWLGDSQ